MNILFTSCAAGPTANTAQPVSNEAPVTIEATEAKEAYQNALTALEDGDWLVAQYYLDNTVEQLMMVLAADSVTADQEESVLNYLRMVLDQYELLYPGLAGMGQVDTGIGFLFPEQEDDVYLTPTPEEVDFLDTLDLSSFSLPIVLHERVLEEIHYLSHRVPSFMQASLNRKSLFEPMIRAKLKEKQMPQDLLYLALVESGYKPKAFSRAGASGIWQFIPATGRRYGMAVDWWVDMRRNPELATDAALAYLGDLYKEFGDWWLAMAAYNCGEGRVRRTIKSAGHRNYWDLELPKETMHYVPRILAATIIGRHPEYFGFTPELMTRPSYDTLTVRHCLPLKIIADSLRVSVDSIRELNIELKQWCTPPNGKPYLLKVPVGRRDDFLRAYAKMDTTLFSQWHRHKVAWGENVSIIAEKYGLRARDVMDANNMKSSRLQAGQYLIIPLPIGVLPSAPSQASTQSKPQTTGTSSKALINGQYRVYEVVQGDNLFDIGRRYGVGIQDLQEWNQLKDSRLFIGQKLRIYSGAATSEQRSVSKSSLGSGNTKQVNKTNTQNAQSQASRQHKSVYTVQRGDNLYSIAKSRGVQVNDIKKWNSLQDNRIFIGQKIVLYTGNGMNPNESASQNTSAMAKVVWYKVQSGDTLWDISRKYGVSVAELQEWNTMENGLLQPGRLIKVKVK